MKRIILLIIVFGMALANAFAAQVCPATGRVVDQQGQAVEYATVVLLKGSQQVAGMASDTKGRFELNVPAGEYTLSVQYLGFAPIRRQVRIEEQNDLGDIVLAASATQIEGVEVKAQLIRREADRFIVDVANTPASLGKDGIELLEHAPGIWIDGEKITINGKSGSKVFINDRELRYEPEQLINYLRSLKAEDIQKIEVVPTAGADYDANSAGGIIKITLRKRRTDGIEGSVSIDSRQSEFIHAYSPNGRINIHSARLDLYASGWGWLGNNKMLSKEQTHYALEQTELHASSTMNQKSYNGGATVGAVYELNDRNSIGGEFSYLHIGEPSFNSSSTDLLSTATTHTDSRYKGQSHRNGYEATLNYIHKLDTLGSTLKLIGDFAHRTTINDDNNSSRISTSGGIPTDSLYRNNTQSSYYITSLTLALEKKFSPRWLLRAGAKYTRNDMRNDALYEYLKGGAWVRNDNQSFDIDYTEDIAALYGIATAKLGRWSLVAGLRAEYTHAVGKGGVNQSYFSLFPNANISYALSKDGACSLVAQYARTISRPSFWMLSPQRMQISDYTYQTGNPALDPAHTHDAGITLVLKHKYTISGGVRIMTGEIQQMMLADKEDPNMLNMTWGNFDATTNYYLSANLPFQLTKWWTLNIGANYTRQQQRIDDASGTKSHNLFYATASTTFTLPCKFYIDLGYQPMSRMYSGTISVMPQHRLSASVKKRFGEKATLWFGAVNLLDQGQEIVVAGEGFVRSVKVRQVWSNRTWKMGVSFNFKSGKTFKAKAVEAGSAEEKGRM